MKNIDYKKFFDSLIMLRLYKINHQIYLRHNELLMKHGLTVQQSRVLGYITINREKKDIIQKDIEEHMELKGSSVSTLIKTMIDKELVIKTQNADDKRVYNLDITEKGLKLHKVAIQILKDYNSDLTKGISEEKISETMNILNEIEENLGKSK